MGDFHELKPNHPVQEGQIFRISRAPLTDFQVDQLVRYSEKDPLVQAFTSDPIRFRDRNAYEQFSGTGRVTYPIIDEAGNFCGLSWRGRKNLPTDVEYTEEAPPDIYPFTKATRLYGPARGVGLAVEVVRFVTEDTLHEHPGTGIWVAISVDNTRSLQPNKQAGYRQISRTNGNNKVVLAYRGKA